MTFNRDEAFGGQCCTDCLMLLANGDTPGHMSAAEIAEWQAGIAQHTAGCEVTLGMFREDHPCRTNFTVTYAPSRYSRQRLTVEVLADDIADARYMAEFEIPAGAHVLIGWPHLPRRHDLMTVNDLGGECECEQLGFSWSPCDVCGSNLGGNREAVVFWPQPDAQPPALASTEPAPEPADPEARVVNRAANALAVAVPGWQSEETGERLLSPPREPDDEPRVVTASGELATPRGYVGVEHADGCVHAIDLDGLHDDRPLWREPPLCGLATGVSSDMGGPSALWMPMITCWECVSILA